MTDETTSLQRELRQRRPFRSPAHAATVAVLRTADAIGRTLARAVEPHGVTPQQYNVLRILRGAHPDPLPTLEVGERMIERTPGVTRLLDRLEAKALVRRDRCPEDRRRVHCRITEEGLALLAELDPAVDAVDEEAMRGLDEAEARTLLALLDRVRARLEE